MTDRACAVGTTARTTRITVAQGQCGGELYRAMRSPVSLRVILSLGDCSGVARVTTSRTVTACTRRVGPFPLGTTK